jgi:hypothetical protein
VQIGPISPPPELPGRTLGLWSWQAPDGRDGILPGEFGVFAVSVPGPTVPAWVLGAFGTIAYDPWPEPDPNVPEPGGALRGGSSSVYTCAPGEGISAGCPDLIVEILNETCWWECYYPPDCPHECPLYLIPHVDVRIRLTNVGAVSTGGTHYVYIENLARPSIHDGKLVGALAPGESRTADLSMVGLGAGELCAAYRVVADYREAILECDERNNEAWGESCCAPPSADLCD